MIITTAVRDNEDLRRIGGDLLPTTLGETLSETFGDPLFSPLESLFRRAEIGAERGLGGQNPIGRVARSREAEEDLTPFVDPEVLNEKYGHLGLKFSQPTRAAVAALMAETKREERRRQSVIERGPRGFLPAAAQFGVGFLRSAIDPLNVAAAFVPVVGQARYAGMVARMGVTRARLATGAIEGLAGSVALEPLTFGLARSLQLDYEMSDALVNVAFGTLLGGGLHLAGGKVADLIAARREPTAAIDRVDALPPSAREAALIKGIADAYEGRPIDVEPAIRIAEHVEALGDGPKPSRRPAVEPLTPDRAVVDRERITPDGRETTVRPPDGAAPGLSAVVRASPGVHANSRQFGVDIVNPDGSVERVADRLTRKQAVERARRELAIRAEPLGAIERSVEPTREERLAEIEADVRRIASEDPVAAEREAERAERADLPDEAPEPEVDVAALEPDALATLAETLDENELLNFEEWRAAGPDEVPEPVLLEIEAASEDVRNAESLARSVRAAGECLTRIT